MDYEERITAAELGEGEAHSEVGLRPQTLDDYIGQKKPLKILRYLLRPQS